MKKLLVILAALVLACSGATAPESLKPSELTRAMRTCDLEVLSREAARARIDVSIHYYEPEKAHSALWRWRLIDKAIDWCGSKT